MAKKSASVKIRKPDTFRTIPITSDAKPEIIAAVTEKWQRIITLIARLLEVPAALIMRIDEKNMQVFLKSGNTENPYPENGTDELGNGLYCETVIGTNRELLVPSALEDKVWNKNPDIKLGMISYYGLPIQWPDTETFGTICVLDSKENLYNETYKELMTEFKLSIEKDLDILMNREKLRVLAERDTLTSLYNRRKSSEVLELEFNRSIRYRTPLTIGLIDLDKFKRINDEYGHEIGDVAILGFTEVVNSRIRSTDIFGRWGGDEFILICPSTRRDGVVSLIEDIGGVVEVETDDKSIKIHFSCGVAECKTTDGDIGELFNRADQELYKEKARKSS